MPSRFARRYLSAACGARRIRPLRAKGVANKPARRPERVVVSKRLFDLESFERHGQQYFEWDDADDVTVVRLPADALLDYTRSEATFAEVQRLVTEGGRRNVVVDLGQVEAMGGFGVSRLVRLYKKLRDRGGRLALCGLAPLIFELFRITHLDRLFTIRPDRAQAANALA